MSQYCVNKNAQTNGDHEVHEKGCRFIQHATLLSNSNFIDLGNHNSCEEAVREAKKHFDQVNGCYYCAKACHTQ